MPCSSGGWTENPVPSRHPAHSSRIVVFPGVWPQKSDKATPKGEEKGVDKAAGFLESPSPPDDGSKRRLKTDS